MKTAGATTQKLCWKVSVKINDEIVFDKEYPSLKFVGNDLGLTYNRISELAIGRIKQRKGTFEPLYIFEKL